VFNLFKRKKPEAPLESGMAMFHTAADAVRLCRGLDDRVLIHVIMKALENTLMSREDFLILRLRIDGLYDRRFDKSVQDHSDPV
jgi:hypothetical protein